jgi:hypothetical protein
MPGKVGAVPIDGAAHAVLPPQHWQHDLLSYSLHLPTAGHKSDKYGGASEPWLTSIVLVLTVMLLLTFVHTPPAAAAATQPVRSPGL